MDSRWQCFQAELEKGAVFPPIVMVEQSGCVPLGISTQKYNLQSYDFHCVGVDIVVFRATQREGKHCGVEHVLNYYLAIF